MNSDELAMTFSSVIPLQLAFIICISCMLPTAG